MPPKKGKDKDKKGKGETKPKKKPKKEEEAIVAVEETEEALAPAPAYTREQIDLIKNMCAKKATDDELAMFLHTCKLAGVDPLRKQAHFIKIGDSPFIMIGIDGFQARAIRDPRYVGIQAQAVRENDEFKINPIEGNVEHSFGMKNRGKIGGAYAVLKRQGMQDAVVWVTFDEYVRKTSIWVEKPEVMITKVARATLLRREYPDNFSGTYAPEEFGGEMNDRGELYMPEERKPVKETPAFPSEGVQDTDFKEVKDEPTPEPEESDEFKLPDDLVETDDTPREALTSIMDYGFKEQCGDEIRPTIFKHFPEYESGDLYPMHISESAVISIVEDLTGMKLKKVEKAIKCENCDSAITEPESEEQDKFCLKCYAEQ